MGKEHNNYNGAEMIRGRILRQFRSVARRDESDIYETLNGINSFAVSFDNGVLRIKQPQYFNGSAHLDDGLRVINQIVVDGNGVVRCTRTIHYANGSQIELNAEEGNKPRCRWSNGDPSKNEIVIEPDNYCPLEAGQSVRFDKDRLLVGQRPVWRKILPFGGNSIEVLKLELSFRNGLEGYEIFAPHPKDVEQLGVLIHEQTTNPFGVGITPRRD